MNIVVLYLLAYHSVQDRKRRKLPGIFSSRLVCSVECVVEFDVILGLRLLFHMLFVLFVGDREKFALPESMPILHMELTQFYFPGDIEFPSKTLIFQFDSTKFN